MPERTTTPDIITPPERVLFQEGLVGLQARLLIGGTALNPNKLDLSAVTREALGNFESRNYSPFISASTRERKEHWQGKDNNVFAQQKQTWINNLVTLFDKNKSFFHNDSEGKQWSDLFSKLGINTQEFTHKSAEAFYTRYFSSAKKDSSVKQFVQDILSAFKKPDGQIDYQQLMQNLNGIQWLAHLFGDMSSEVISQLIDAESQLQTQPDSLIQQTNETKDNIIRINSLLPKEKELLAFLSDSTIPAVQPIFEKNEQETKGKRLGDFLMTYFRPGVPRVFPERFSAFDLLAQDLKDTFPHEFADDDVQAIGKRIKRETEQIQKDLDDYGLTSEELHNLTFRPIEETVLRSYRSFIQNTYGLTLPSTEKLQVIPIKGTLSKLFNPQGKTLAFVNTTAPFIFLDFDSIEKEAKKKAHTQGWQVMTKPQFGEFLKSLLAEIQPHEYTHLLADLAYWTFSYLDPHGITQLAQVIPERVGLLLAKVKDLKLIPQGLAYTPVERGRGLMEAVTVELTAKWAENQNVGPLDIPAYAGERTILYELQNMLLREDGIHKDESFKIFVHAYFTRDGFRKLVETIDGHSKENDRFFTKRPHLTSIVYGLMEYEGKKYQGTMTAPVYPLTYYFLQKRLSPQQKQEILANLDQIYLAPAVKEELRRQLS